MVEKSKSLEQPSWNAIVWRYMGIDKFFDMIRNERLVFNRVDSFTDKNELIFQWLFLEDESSVDEKEASKFLRRCLDLKTSTYVSSWSAQQTESFGLWKVYLGGNNPGVAIKTNYKSLLESIQSSEHKVFSGRVKYYRPVGGNNYEYIRSLDDDQLIGTKYAGYSYEHEVRLFLKNEYSGVGYQNVVSVPVDLNMLIHEIYLSPWIAAWFRGTFAEIVEKLKPSISNKLSQSRINDHG